MRRPLYVTNKAMVHYMYWMCAHSAKERRLQEAHSRATISLEAWFEFVRYRGNSYTHIEFYEACWGISNGP
jgi:hypothetical protein